MEGKLLPRKINLQKYTRLVEALLLAIRLLVSIHLQRNWEQTWKICEDIKSNPKREIYILCKDLHRDGCFKGTPISHKPEIQG
jgi:hypothetical protein